MVMSKLHVLMGSMVLGLAILGCSSQKQGKESQEKEVMPVAPMGQPLPWNRG